jgi:hypothetical protein
VTVFIYPTLRIIVAELQRLLNKLGSNSAVGKILIKEHPGVAKQLRHQIQTAGVEFAQSIPEEDHISLVGNSSVTIELIHCRIPVYQNFDFDPVGRDYYGFVRSGLTFEVKLAELSSAFWRPCDADDRWLNAFVEWDASANGTYLDDQVQFVEEMARLAVNSRTDMSPRRRRSMKARLKGGLKRGVIRLVNANKKLSSRAANFLFSCTSRAANPISVTTDRLGRFLLANTDIEIDAPIWRTPSRTTHKTTSRGSEIRFEDFVGYTLTQLPNPAEWLRMSDGAGYLFPDRHHFLQADVANRERHWWGTELPTKLRSEIISEARQAIAEADVVGVPAIYRFIRDHSESSRSLTQSLMGRGLLEVVLAGVGVVSPSALITEDKANVAPFSNPATLLPLVEAAHKVVIVSSVVPENLPSAFSSTRRLETITIPTHHKTMLNESYSKGSQVLPFLYRSILNNIDKTVVSGDLVLVAGGIIGKILIGRARAMGAVALDLGHVVDDWIHPALPSMR